MSSWTHPICRGDFERLYPDREPVKLKNPHGERCCFCGFNTRDGIYIRWDPAEIPKHKEHQ